MSHEGAARPGLPMPLWEGAPVLSPETGESCARVAVALRQGELELPQVVREPRLSAPVGKGLSKRRGDQVALCTDQGKDNVAGATQHLRSAQDIPEGMCVPDRCPGHGVDVESQPVVPWRPHAARRHRRAHSSPASGLTLTRRCPRGKRRERHLQVGVGPTAGKPGWEMPQRKQSLEKLKGRTRLPQTVRWG